MALTRKMLAAMDIPAEKIDEIISAHTETVNALKTEVEQYKSDAEALKSKEKELETAKKDLEAANKELETVKSSDWEKKYNDLKTEHDTFKKDTEAKATKAAKEAAYKKLLSDAGISTKRIDSVLKVSAEAIDKIVLDKDGNITDADKLTESVKTEWADFISTQHEEGAPVPKPPVNTGGGDSGKPSRAAELAAKYNAEHYGKVENKEG